MRAISLVLLIALATATADSTRFDVKDAPTLFDKFVEEYNKQYIDEADRKLHYEAFVKNLETINKQNAADPDATYGITQFADQTEKEKGEFYGFI